ncbi:transglutaminase-like cysteine peptidase [Agaribacter marinus]|uniref:Sulfate adenylyltransferase n=1 Tax=Agaribacter marinus TaxID=1431249 RepID=A0AA37T0X7_9ALTE|nr:transglutaminase-like cysteine peptidase [Agaribacter marinus]GLR72877.1 sulfate adenylyltransferase [Agaribacter marinus]
MLIAQYGLSKINFNEKLFEAMKSKYGDDAEGRAREWQALINEHMNEELEEQLFAVNKFFNQHEFVNDVSQWGASDYWATPTEFIGHNAGDCEDFVIAKYFTLLEMGVSNDKLRLMYVTATRPTRQAHMVLAYYEQPNSVPLVLDNINRRILPASKRRDLIPIFSFNGDGLWLAKSQGRGRKVQKGGQNSMWVDLNKRMQEELK